MSFVLDCLEAMDSHRGDLTDDRLRDNLHNRREAQFLMMMDSHQKIATSVARLEVIAEKESGLVMDMKIPLMAYHDAAARQKVRDLRAGITNTTGYECWEDKEYCDRWRRLNPEMTVKEAPTCKNSSIIVPATKYTSTSIASDTHRSETVTTNA